MTFNSYIFILLFLPICMFGYFTFNRFGYYRTGLIFLLGMSLWFYGFFNPKYLIIICSSVTANYIVYRLLKGMDSGKGNGTVQQGEQAHGDILRLKRRIVFIIGLIFNIGLLGYFKYTDFFIENINVIFQTNLALRKILLPLGISFFTFQQISFIADVYNAGGVFHIRFLNMRHMSHTFRS